MKQSERSYKRIVVKIGSSLFYSDKKKLDFCFECADFPCNLLHPLADRADVFPHNLKVFNLCLIKRLGVDNWAKNNAKESFDKYYKDKIDL